VYHTIGFTKNQITRLCARIYKALSHSDEWSWPPILGLYKSTVIALTYLRRNRTQAEIAETYGVSQPTISRAITAMTPMLGAIVADCAPVAEDLHPDEHDLVDGTLLPCWSWSGH
jgi:hypothetical protein